MALLLLAFPQILLEFSKKITRLKQNRDKMQYCAKFLLVFAFSDVLNS